MRVRVRLYGMLKTAAKTEELELELDTAISVRQFMGRLAETIQHPEFDAHLIDADLKDPRANALIIVSGTEISALDGLETLLKDGDEVVLLPVAHGGSQ